MRNQIASIGINQSEETYLLAPKSLYKGEPLSVFLVKGFIRQLRDLHLDLNVKYRVSQKKYLSEISVLQIVMTILDHFGP